MSSRSPSLSLRRYGRDRLPPRRLPAGPCPTPTSSRAGSPPPGSTDEGDIALSERRPLGLTLEANATHSYDAEVGGFSLSFLTIAGGQVFRTDDTQLYTFASRVTEGSQSINNSAGAASEDFTLDVANYGVFLQENVGFRDNLFLDLGGRLDGNSAFGEDHRARVLPQGRLSPTRSPTSRSSPGTIPTSVVSNLKLRATYGAAGNFPTPFANARTILVESFDNVPAYTFDQSGAPGPPPRDGQHVSRAALDLALNGGRVVPRGDVLQRPDRRRPLPGSRRALRPARTTSSATSARS